MNTVLLEKAISLAWQARAEGNRPFGSLITDPEGKIIAQGVNTVLTSGDVTGHSETNALRAALQTVERPGPALMAGHTLYSSAEPCMMCTGALYLAGVSRVVYALNSAELEALAGPLPRVRTLPFSLDLALQAGDGNTVADYVPLPAASDVHRGYWKEP
ncbi:nucleoside deaminase [Arthrobacter bambusae]|uniref:nucleoside deaminase n=1 Tax=Arthrobacter bambusae TaxID=1338426 RepID=UPI0027892B85|nr:nucleoside deaminase [Arthrobacter bambusae]MDQ0239544.1 tRNA(Arg) A34 adenosine deaminase TadA [Arthrobacter bambusae]